MEEWEQKEQQLRAAVDKAAAALEFAHEQVERMPGMSPDHKPVLRRLFLADHAHLKALERYEQFCSTHPETDP
ncbi:hypothetical protein [Cellulomonas soli]|nr:hypothetical protein [Cellulomonas soli]NYI60319.1 mannose/fructose/N-acetylgalactosamine-specific phosphotransferase system component IID [Cellulomonas soli]